MAVFAQRRLKSGRLLGHAQIAILVLALALLFAAGLALDLFRMRGTPLGLFDFGRPLCFRDCILGKLPIVVRTFVAVVGEPCLALALISWSIGGPSVLRAGEKA